MKLKNLALLFLPVLFIGCDKTSFKDLNSPEALHDRSVGASANELLSSAKYKSLKIEVQYMTGFAPDASALDQLHGFLSTYLSKPNGITIVTKEISSWSMTTLAIKDVTAIEQKDRSLFSGGDSITIYILYTNGDYTDNTVLGIAYRNTSLALFGKTIYDNSGGIGQSSRTKLEATVLEHEVGHLLGLVDQGSSMQTPHMDANHINHCNNSNCLMYYAAETKDILGLLTTGNVPALDDNCLADIHANGGK